MGLACALTAFEGFWNQEGKEKPQRDHPGFSFFSPPYFPQSLGTSREI